MNILSVQGLAKAHGEKQLFTDVTFGLEERDRAAMIGPNGCGKSTLLRIVAGLESADAGTVVLSQGLTARYLSQHPQSEPGQTALDFVFAGGGKAASLVRQYEALQQRMALGEAGAADADRLEKLSRRMDAADAWQYETRARAILTKLGIDRTDVPMDTLSGGFRRRVALARVLVEQPDLLILDEPTNHLDVELIEWLEDLLRRYPGTVLLVTHDRYFLDRVSRRILEIDRGRIFQFEGNWQNYLRRKAEMAEADAAESRRLKSMLREDTAWAQRGARARRTKERKRYDKMDARQYRLDELQGRGPGDAPTFEVETRRLGKKIVELDGVSKRLGDNPILENFHYLFAPGERLGIVGPNGSGKSTLANLIAGRLQPDSGTIDVGETVKFGYFTQEAAELPLHERVIDYVKREGGEMLPRPGGGHVTAEVMLGDFFFPPQAQYAPIGKLSGGERRRLHLVLTLMRDPNFLIFDEPTNDLDLMTLQALEEFLDGFSGCLIVISHDRWFLDRNVEHLLIFDLPEPGHPPRIRRFEGNYTDWREARESEAGRGGPAGDPKTAGTATQVSRGRPAANSGAPAEKPSGGKTTGGNVSESSGPAKSATGAKGRTERAPRLSYMEKRELEELERRTIEMEERMRTLDAQMTEHATNYERLRELAREREQLETELGKATSRWEELAERA